MTILLGGVWIVSVQSDVKEQDIETWSESGEYVDETSVMNERSLDVEEVPHIPPRFENHSIPMDRGTRSESNISDLTKVDGSSAQGSAGPLCLGFRHYISRERIASISSHSQICHRRWTTFDDGRASTLHRRLPLLPINTLGTGFQIGLSPVSPGFVIQPRGRNMSGRGIADVGVNATRCQERQRRRTVSEGDVRKGVLAPSRPDDGGNADDGAGSVEGVAGAIEGKREWSWLRYVLRR